MVGPSSGEVVVESGCDKVIGRLTRGLKVYKEDVYKGM